MACGASFYEDDPLKDKQREENRLKRDKENADKIVKFFAKAGLESIAIQRIGGDQTHEVKKIFVTKSENILTILHRGYKISVACDPIRWALELERWRSCNMTHARIVRQDH